MTVNIAARLSLLGRRSRASRGPGATGRRLLLFSILSLLINLCLIIFICMFFLILFIKQYIIIIFFCVCFSKFISFYQESQTGLSPKRGLFSWTCTLGVGPGLDSGLRTYYSCRNSQPPSSQPPPFCSSRFRTASRSKQGPFFKVAILLSFHFIVFS